MMDVPTIGPKPDAPSRTPGDASHDNAAESFSQYLDDTAPPRRSTKSPDGATDDGDDRGGIAPTPIVTADLNVLTFIPTAAGLFSAATAQDFCAVTPPVAPMTPAAVAPPNATPVSPPPSPPSIDGRVMESATPMVLSVPMQPTAVDVSSPALGSVAPLDGAPPELASNQIVSIPPQDVSIALSNTARAVPLPATEIAVPSQTTKSAPETAAATQAAANPLLDRAIAASLAPPQPQSAAANVLDVAAPAAVVAQATATAASVAAPLIAATAAPPPPQTANATPKAPTAVVATEAQTPTEASAAAEVAVDGAAASPRKAKTASGSHNTGAGNAQGGASGNTPNSPATNAAAGHAPSSAAQPNAPSPLLDSQAAIRHDASLAPLTTDGEAISAPTVGLHTGETRTGASAATAAAAAASAPRTAAPHMQLAQQIVRRFDGGSTTLDIRLDPIELGRIDVRIEVGRDRRVGVAIAAENPATLTEIARSSRDLERILEAAGLDVSNGGLTFSLAQDQNSRQSNGRDGAAPTRDISAADMPDAPAPAAARPFGLESWRVGRIDILA